MLLIFALFHSFFNSVFLRTIDNEWVSGRESLEIYAAALRASGCPLENCVGKKKDRQIQTDTLYRMVTQNCLIYPLMVLVKMITTEIPMAIMAAIIIIFIGCS